MSAKKTCVGCGKQIPDTAVVCVFCSAKQPSSDPELAEAATVDVAAAQAAVVSKHATDPTLLGLKASDVTAELDKQQADSSQPTADSPGNGASATHLTAAMQAVTLDTPEIPEPEVDTPIRPVDRRLVAAADALQEPWGALGRLIMGIGGGVLIALFFCPWHGVSSWQLLETLAGAEFVRQLFYLTGGIVLLAASVLPLPFIFRAAVGASVAAMPVILGAGGVIDGWRGLVAALAILGLPATHLLRSRAQTSSAARTLVMAAVAAVALLYILPVSSVVPIAAVFKMMGSGLGYAVFGIYVLIPLVFAGLSLLGVLGRDLTEVGVLLSVLILLWAPVGIALRGMMIDDGTQLYVAVALLWASATAALSLAQLLSLAATRPRTA